MPRFYKYKYTLMLIKNWPLARGKEFYFLNEHNHTPSGKKKTVSGVQVITASQVQSIGWGWQALFILLITVH